MNFFTDRKSRLPRLWSNRELKKFSHLFTGDVVNVSAWQDKDKEGHIYEDYFSSKSSYKITNYKAEARGLQHVEHEFFLDLEANLPIEQEEKFDVVFSHTVLEHTYRVEKAFENLCLMSRDIVIVVVPFLQPMHGEYGDYWRFTPTCLQNLFEQNGLSVLYCSFNNHVDAAVYIFCIAAKNPERWNGIIESNLDVSGSVQIHAKPFLRDGFPEQVGTNSILNVLGYVGTVFEKIRRLLSLVR